MTTGTQPSFSQLTLTVTERCNQRCRYCYVDVDRGRTMSFDVAERALRLLFDAAPAGEPVAVSFFGGEPFLVPGLLRRIAERARELAGPDRRLELTVSTNGTAVDAEGMALMRELGMRVAVSYDGDQGQQERPLARGGSSLPDIRDRLPDLLGLDIPRPLGRLTVTPDNVAFLADNVRTVHGAGFDRILYLPAFEADWSGRALAEWARQHDRLATWLIGLRGGGGRAPVLPAWRGIFARLRGSPRRHCGAGVNQVTVSVDGRIYPCYRSVYDPGGEQLVLGDVWEGLTQADRRGGLAALDPERPRPAAGSCDDCSARDGCGFFCPALGHLLLGNTAAVPESACALTRVQVALCRRLLEADTRGRRSPRRKLWAAAALAAAFLGGGSAACDRFAAGSVDGTVGHDSVVVDDDGTIGPGVCPVQLDAGDDATIGPGQCPYPIDAGLYDATVGPGLCPHPIDGGIEPHPDGSIGPGLCPWVPDSGTPEDGGMPPGIC